MLADDGIELVSRVMETDAPWQSEITGVWNTHLRQLNIEYDRACGTYIPECATL